jgi:hypothetical protein
MSAQLKFGIFERELVNPLAGHALTDLEEFVASALLNATSERPMKIGDLIVAFGSKSGEWPSDREIKEVVRALRQAHAFPIISRRSKPAGLWWCGSLDEMREFITSFRKQALDELLTLSKIVRHNFPELAGQLTLEDVPRIDQQEQTTSQEVVANAD